MTRIWKIRIFSILNYSLVLNTCIVNLFKTTCLIDFYILNHLGKKIVEIGRPFRPVLFTGPWISWPGLQHKGSRPDSSFTPSKFGRTSLLQVSQWNDSWLCKKVRYGPWYIHVISVAHYFFALHQIDFQSLKRASMLQLYQKREFSVSNSPKTSIHRPHKRPYNIWGPYANTFMSNLKFEEFCCILKLEILYKGDPWLLKTWLIN